MDTTLSPLQIRTLRKIAAGTYRAMMSGWRTQAALLAKGLITENEDGSYRITESGVAAIPAA